MPRLWNTYSRLLHLHAVLSKCSCSGCDADNIADKANISQAKNAKLVKNSSLRSKREVCNLRCRAALSQAAVCAAADADALETVQNGYDVSRLDREVVRLIKQLALTVGKKHKNRREDKFETTAQADR